MTLTEQKERSSLMRYSTVRTNPRGLTLLEVMISSTLILLVLGSLTGIVFSMAKNHELQMLRNDMQDQTLKLVTRVTQELAETSSATIQTSPQGLVFASPRDSDGTIVQNSNSGKIRWNKFVSYHVSTKDGTPTVVRTEKDIPSRLRVGSEPPEPTGDFALSSMMLEKPTSVVARHINEFSCQRFGELVRFQVVVKKHYPRLNRDYQMMTRFGYTARN